MSQFGLVIDKETGNPIFDDWGKVPLVAFRQMTEEQQEYCLSQMNEEQKLAMLKGKGEINGKSIYNFIVTEDFFSDEINSQYCAGLSYTVHEGNELLHQLVQKWYSEGKVLLR